MKPFARIACLGAVAIAMMAGGAPIQAQTTQSPTSAWGDSVTFRGPIDRSADLQRAEAIERARRGGYGPGDTNITYEGEVVNNNTYNGNVSNSSSTNAVNYTENSSSVRAGTGAYVGITYTTGSTSYQANQNATSQVSSAGPNGQSSVNASGGTGNQNDPD